MYDPNEPLNVPREKATASGRGNVALAVAILLVLLTPGLLSAICLSFLSFQTAYSGDYLILIFLFGCPISGGIGTRMLAGSVARKTGFEVFAWWLVFTATSLALAFGGCMSASLFGPLAP